MLGKATESEQKVSNIVKTVISSDLTGKPDLNDQLDSISLAPYSFSENLPKAMVVKMPEELLRFVKMNYKEFVSMMKKEFSGYIILTMREGAIPPKNKLNPVRGREEVLKDILFPAKVMGRTQDIESREEVVQNVYLDNKQQYWSQSEVATIQKVASKILNDTFIVGMFTSN